MLTETFILLRQELLVALFIVVLLVLKVRGELKNEVIIHLVNLLLLGSLIAGLLFHPAGNLFGEMYRTNSVVVLEKNILTLGTLIISLQSFSWLKAHKHITEFYVLLLSTL